MFIVSIILCTLSDHFVSREFVDAAEEGFGKNEIDLLTYTINDVFIDASKSCLNFAVIPANAIAVKPSALEFNMGRVMSGFIRLVQDRLVIRSPLTFTDDEPITWWNKDCEFGVRDTMNGWGSHPFTYCFDERFLKHVIYYAIGGERVKYRDP